MKTVLAVLLTLSIQGQSPLTGWDVFAKVKFKPKLIKEVNEYFLIPFFDSRIRSYEGKEMTLEGYYIPADLEEAHTIILSRNPYAQCFFCGGAGPESVSEATFVSKPPKFKADQIIRVTGTLRLNDKDISHLNFILENARLEHTYQDRHSIIGITRLLACNSKVTEAKRNHEAIMLHNSMIKRANEIEQRLNELLEASMINNDSISILSAVLKQWKLDLVEVPGSDEHDDHLHHSHHHNMPLDVTDEQMLSIQKELDDRLKIIGRKLEKLES